jgi:DNA-directed RNA polymerase specialized sigma24 family protein
MLIDDLGFRDLLRRLVFHLVAETELRKDLMQEALFHLWRMESQSPGQTSSWYLQSCRYCLQHHLSQGRSIDSWKHHSDRSQNENGDLDSPDCSECDLGFDESLCSCVNAQEMLALLAQRLTGLRRQILFDLADGLDVEDIAQARNISRQAVTKNRQLIALLALEIGFACPPNRITIKLKQ